MQRIEEIKNYLTHLRENKKQYCQGTSGKGINGKLGLSFEFKIDVCVLARTLYIKNQLSVIKFAKISTFDYVILLALIKKYFTIPKRST